MLIGTMIGLFAMPRPRGKLLGNVIDYSWHFWIFFYFLKFSHGSYIY